MSTITSELIRYEDLYGDRRVALAWPDSAQSLLGEEADRLGATEAAISAAFRDAARASPKFVPRPADVLGRLAPPAEGRTQLGADRPSCNLCAGGLRSLHFGRGERNSANPGRAWAAACDCPSGRAMAHMLGVEAMARDALAKGADWGVDERAGLMWTPRGRERLRGSARAQGLSDAVVERVGRRVLEAMAGKADPAKEVRRERVAKTQGSSHGWERGGHHGQ